MVPPLLPFPGSRAALLGVTSLVVREGKVCRRFYAFRRLLFSFFLLERVCVALWLSVVLTSFFKSRCQVVSFLFIFSFLQRSLRVMLVSGMGCEGKQRCCSRYYGLA
jgi:hypothetical protein